MCAAYYFLLVISPSSMYPTGSLVFQPFTLRKLMTMQYTAKLLSLLALCASFSTVAAAEGVFVGGSLDAYHTKYKNTLCDAEDDCSFSDSRMGVGLKAGYDFDQFRVYGAYQYSPKSKTFEYEETAGSYKFDYEESVQSHDLTIGADYTPSFTNNFKGLIGGYVGYSRLKVKANGQESVAGKITKTSESAGTNGVIYGVRLGGIYSFNQNNELEFGVKAEQAKYKAVEGDDWEFKEKTTNYGAFVGYNYKF